MTAAKRKPLTPEQRTAHNARKRELRQRVPAGEARRRYNSLPLRSELPAERLQTLRDADRRRQSGMTPDEAAAALALQQGKCAICAAELAALPSKQVCADHCHESGRPRGLLCHKCNTALGLFGDSIGALQAAIEYLQRPPLGML